MVFLALVCVIVAWARGALRREKNMVLANALGNEIHLNGTEMGAGTPLLPAVFQFPSHGFFLMRGIWVPGMQKSYNGGNVV